MRILDIIKLQQCQLPSYFPRISNVVDYRFIGGSKNGQIMSITDNLDQVKFNCLKQNIPIHDIFDRTKVEVSDLVEIEIYQKKVIVDNLGIIREVFVLK